MVGKRVYVMSLKVLLKLKNRFGVVRCGRCGGEIKVGDLVVSRPCNGRGYFYRIFHKKCWEGMFY